MKDSSRLADFILPWTGLAAGTLAAGLTHQIGSEGVFDHCAAFSPIPLLLISLVGIAMTVAGGLASWRVLRVDSETQARKVIAAISVGAAALYVFAILLPMIASLVIPPCFG